MECRSAEGRLKIFATHTEFMNSMLDLLSPNGPENLPLFDRSGLLKAVLAQFRISRHGVHGPSHWARVRSHAFTVGKATGVDLLVVELFAFLHDSQRENEWIDPNHGSRAAEYASSLNRIFFDLNGDQLDMLWYSPKSVDKYDVKTEMEKCKCRERNTPSSSKTRRSSKSSTRATRLSM
jgi:hypothetical protein